jgi:SAM-dependent methyltransferase
VTETLIEPIYFYQDTWAFEKIVQQRPKHHIDVGSHHKYVTLLSKVVPVTIIDLRPWSLPLDTVRFQKGSILELPFENNSVESVSSLCVVEHIGLGRYGDLLDPEGSEKAINELKRIIRPRGNLYLSVPINDENRTYFNAHRVFSEDYLKTLFHPFAIVEQRYIYGNDFREKRLKGFGIGLYHLRNPHLI